MDGNPFVQAFVDAALEVLSELPPDAYSWSGSAQHPPARLSIKPSKGGFPVEMRCEIYGVYPNALGWHGAPWDVTVYPPEAIAKETKDFLTSVLSTTSRLEIHRSSGKPYKHALWVMWDGKLVADVEATRFYNWFGTKSVEILKNTWLTSK